MEWKDRTDIMRKVKSGVMSIEDGLDNLYMIERAIPDDDTNKSNLRLKIINLDILELLGLLRSK